MDNGPRIQLYASHPAVRIFLHRDCPSVSSVIASETLAHIDAPAGRGLTADGSAKASGPRCSFADGHRGLPGSWFDTADAEMDLRTLASALHSDRYIEADVTAQSCWDADRVDLGHRAAAHPSHTLAPRSCDVRMS